MENRFFNINSNIYLNSIYILAILLEGDKKISAKKLLISLYLIRNPMICINLLKGNSKKAFLKHIQDFELYNIQTDMEKYSSKLFVDGFNEAIEFLISKNIISYDDDSSNIIELKEYKEINKKIIPQELIYKARYTNRITEKYIESELEIMLMNYGEKSNE